MGWLLVTVMRVTPSHVAEQFTIVDSVSHQRRLIPVVRSNSVATITQPYVDAVWGWPFGVDYGFE
jgi:hypothetical protein